ncbi:uncharacterized protein LOC134195201 [Corticium candelabrum]|uniref:uncharacterized protein LOC134195201 n=1 Tax=Corticium candelabrum TaxID=121492 RepID=UPI002E25B31C|nr:uncharacterized protein LOC134195201 [Corticium candelabrum]
MSSTVIAKTVAIPTDSSDTIQGRSSRKRIDAYRSSHKWMICNVHAFFEQEKRDGPIMLESVTKTTAMVMQVSERTVFRVHCQVNVEGDVHSPAKKGKKSGSGPAQQETDNFQEGVIRRRIHRFYTDRELPTILALQQDIDYSYSKQTLLKTVKKMGFKYTTCNKKTVLYEQHRIIAACHHYLRQVKKYRDKGRPIVYLDETWLNVHHTLERRWTDYDGKGGLRVPSGKGGRLIILHAGWKEGWISNADLVFRGKKGTGDYHQEMNTAHLMEWFRERLIPNLPATSVLFLTMPSIIIALLRKSRQKAAQKGHDPVSGLA